MDLNSYQSQAAVTESPVGVETFRRMMSAAGQWTTNHDKLVEILCELDFDAMKRFVFYDAPGPVVSSEEEAEIRLHHGNLGLITEVLELQQLLREQDIIDKVHLMEELGDLMWYIALIASSQNVTLDDVCQRNIDKLRARYPNKFTEYDAKNRDLDNERKVLEGSKEESSSMQEIDPHNKCTGTHEVFPDG